MFPNSTTGDSSSIWAFARQFQPRNARQVIQIYQHATLKPYSYLMGKSSSKFSSLNVI